MSKSVVKPPSNHKAYGENARRVFKSVLDTVKSLDEVTKKRLSSRDLFTSEITYYRYRLKDYCERLLFIDPLEYGRKAEEIIWRKVFYDAIQTVKQFKKSNKLPKNLVTPYFSHLMAASGYYTHLLYRFQSEFNLNLQQIADCCYQKHQRSAVLRKAAVFKSMENEDWFAIRQKPPSLLATDYV